MSRHGLKLVLIVAILAISWFVGNPKNQPFSAPKPGATENRRFETNDARQSWGRPETLADHFVRHGRDFNARDANDYAAQAAAFMKNAKIAGFPAKRDTDGTLRIYDWVSGAFGSYNADGTTRTYFKPGKRDYFERQPGMHVDLRTVQ